MRILGAALAMALAATPQTAPSIESVRWIAGEWKGSMGKAEIEEHWTPLKGGGMLGVSRTVAGGRMVMFEFLRVVERPDGVFYIAQPGGRSPTDFKLTKATEREAVFENPQHDHPKVISYTQQPDGSLVARLEGDEKGKHVVQEFKFQRVR
jgi:hypothetical protein